MGLDEVGQVHDGFGTVVGVGLTAGDGFKSTCSVAWSVVATG